jgi:hypothetical protein
MQQDGKLSGDGHHGSSSRMASATGTLAATHLRNVESLP